MKYSYQPLLKETIKKTAALHRNWHSHSWESTTLTTAPTSFIHLTYNQSLMSDIRIWYLTKSPKLQHNFKNFHISRRWRFFNFSGSNLSVCIKYIKINDRKHHSQRLDIIDLWLDNDLNDVYITRHYYLLTLFRCFTCNTSQLELAYLKSVFKNLHLL